MPPISNPNPDVGSRPEPSEGNWRELLEQLQKLVEEQFVRVESLLDQYDALLGDQTVVAQGWLELQEQRRAWESHCEKLSHEINEEYSQLSEGWERLEQYQRHVESTALSSAAGKPAFPAQPAASPPASIPIHAPSVTPPPKAVSATVSASNADLDICDAWTPQLNDAAALQFQQMKRQIRNHSMDNRRR